MDKLERLKILWANLPEQGSEFWLKNRSYAFGGSEIATVLGLNPYCKLKKLIDQKKKCKWTEPNALMNHGNLFEPIALHILERKFGPISHFGAIPHHTLPVAFSPDGLLVHNSDLVLIEIKCPVLRKISIRIPELYKPQVLTGIEICDADVGWFCQFKFRKCCLDDLKFSPEYDYRFHSEKPTGEIPIAIGMILFRRKDPSGFIDFGNAGYKTLKKITNLRKTCRVEFVIYLQSDWPVFKDYYFWKDLEGVMPFKFFEWTLIECLPDKMYLNNITDEVLNAYNLLK
jgi:putative phage-type endonuclease